MTKLMKSVALDSIRYRASLAEWEAECKRRFELRFPKIDFHADTWPIKHLYQTEQPNWYFTQPMADFAEKDISYITALRCLVAEMVIVGKPTHLAHTIVAYRKLAVDSPACLFDLSLADLHRLEERLLAHGKTNPQAAGRMKSELGFLSKQLATLSRKSVLPVFGWQATAATQAELLKIDIAYKARGREAKGELLDRKMEAFNDCINQMIDGAPELSARDRVAIALGIILLCAPSRINEPLCMSIEDHMTVDDYAKKAVGEVDEKHRAHQMLIVTMKGSKGAQWSPKPVLSFMMDAFHFAMGVIKSHGKRSRMLVEWYEQHPNTLYLTPELESLRGKPINRHDLERIIRLDANLPNNLRASLANRYFNELYTVSEPNCKTFVGQNRKKPHNTFPWADVEALLLKKVHKAMDRCRRITQFNSYKGELSKMLLLFDDESIPAYLPASTKYSTIQGRFKRTERGKTYFANLPSIFEKLGITMPVDGRTQIAWMDTHDPRRWLTTMAEKHGENLSDVLINKWANRCKLSQLKAYDFRTAEEKADAASMPANDKLTELSDLSRGLASIEKLEEQFGLQTTFVTAHDAGVSVTSLDAVAQAVEDRPVAKTSHGIIIVYPQEFGVCLHQHHTKPCRSYNIDSCLICKNAVQQKGHIPTNDAVRQVNKKLFNIIVQHLEHLGRTHNRGIADDPVMLGEHMLTLVDKGLSPLGIEQLAIELIENFEEATRLLKDRYLANKLETAYVARQSVKLLDDPATPSGAIFKYHNHKRHAEPLLEIALDEHGGREQVARDEQVLVEKYPEFAATSDNITDGRHLIAADEEED